VQLQTCIVILLGLAQESRTLLRQSQIAMLVYWLIVWHK
jgi:hypothetical protein